MEGMGYVLGDDLRLRQVSTGQSYRYVDADQYQQLGDAVTECVQQLMVERYGMERIELPLDEEVTPWIKLEKGPCPVFLSAIAPHAERLLILICGSGRVRAGLWSRSLCINDSFLSGSVLPFLEWAHANDTAVLVLNPNHEGVVTLGTGPPIPSGTAHVLYAWDAICRRLPAEHIAIVGHSAGGHDSCELIKHREEEVLRRLRCIAFGDTIQLCIQRLPNAARMFLAQNAVDWVASRKPLDTLVRKASPSLDRCKGRGKKPDNVEYNCKEVSAGTNKHVEVVWKAFDSICEFVSLKLNESEQPSSS